MHSFLLDINNKDIVWGILSVIMGMMIRNANKA